MRQITYCLIYCSLTIAILAIRLENQAQNPIINLFNGDHPLFGNSNTKVSDDTKKPKQTSISNSDSTNKAKTKTNSKSLFSLFQKTKDPILKSTISDGCTHPCPKFNQYCDSNECFKCPKNCISCTSATSCTICEYGFYLDGVCKKCPKHCGICKVFSPGEEPTCTFCKSGYIFMDGACVPCQDPHCLRCSKSGCDLCELGWEADSTVTPTVCIPNCQKDSGYCAITLAARGCATCDQPRGALTPYFLCVEIPAGCEKYDFSNSLTNPIYCIKCQNGFIFDQAGNCVACPKNCGKCKYDDAGKIVCKECKEGYHQSENGDCKPCKKGCSKCEKDKDFKYKDKRDERDEYKNYENEYDIKERNNYEGYKQEGAEFERQKEQLKCSECFKGYYLEEGRCKKCYNDLTNCTKFEGCKCLDCAFNYCVTEAGGCSKCDESCAKLQQKEEGKENCKKNEMEDHKKDEHNEMKDEKPTKCKNYENEKKMQDANEYEP